MSYAFYFSFRVRFGVPSVAIFFGSFFTLAKVYATGQFTNYGEIDAPANVLFERRDGDEAVGSEVAGA